ncbi:ChbG/HpnK family deacetylase [Flavihumibacter petaseus]|uniref:Putative hydrolase n=1 Tax=Flavihumibacter petaseus NBRC 106054 TaxID=1220578 RepID=A0A0E9MYK9_9BACT|nr:ChbG/HpnK family deacetylase [Flavihumibacter petaseus]GAO42593.1 putative hydrolase [Flavihumibacter petaseus NBRC 106054]
MKYLMIAIAVLGNISLLSAQTSLPRSTPEAEGVASADISRLLDAMEGSTHQFHSLMILRHGKVITEGWWKPYDKDLVHTMYSVSKSFTATAIGFLVAEKKITVDDKVISFFPDDLPDTVSVNLKSLRIRDLLTMSVGHATEPTFATVSNDNWVKAFLAWPVQYMPGSKFLYNSLATYMLSAIVQKVTREQLLTYLQPRLFTPLGITGIDWETDSRGINTGGWGLRLKTEDMAKFGQLFLQKGQWQGKQILPVSWVTEATTRKIWQDPDAPSSRKDSSDWLQGYCYQMWRGRHNSFRGDGAFGQYILLLPDQDAVVIITSETANMQGELNLIWQYLLPAFREGKLKPAKKEHQALQKRLQHLSVKAEGITGTDGNETEKRINGKQFGIISAQRGFDSISISFSGNRCLVRFCTDSAVHPVIFGKDSWEKGATTRRGPYLVEHARNNRAAYPPMRIAGNYHWQSANTLDLNILYYESPHTETIRCHFQGDDLVLEDISSFDKQHPKNLTAIAITRRTNPPRLIIRGDDMGYSHSGNLALMQCYEKGVETSIEVIAASPWFPEAARMLSAQPNVEVGLHFAITSEWDNVKWRPLTTAASLRDEDGYFYPMLWTNKNYPGQAVKDNPWKLEDVEKELRAQIELVKKYVPRVNHISGHMGSQNLSTDVARVVKKLAAEYGLDAADFPVNKPLLYFPADLGGLRGDAKIDAFLKGLDALEEGRTYLFVEHPGLDNEELRAIHHIGYEDVAADRQGITDLYTDPRVKKAIVQKGILLTGYLPKKQAYEAK